MNRTELHQLELMLAVALVVAEAVLTLTVAGIALVGALLSRGPLLAERAAEAAGHQRHQEVPEHRAAPVAAPPMAHPLARVAEAAEAALAPATVAQLRRQARAVGLPRQLSRAGRRTDLLHALTALEVALAA